MATSAFRSTTSRRTSIGDAGSSTHKNSHRRCRSLSRAPSGDVPSPSTRGKFVNTERGAGLEFPEVSLDDLANEFFPVRDWEVELERERARGGSGRRVSDVSGFAMETESSWRRGRSVSRKRGGGGGRGSDCDKYGGNSGGGSDENVRRRRSVSVAIRRRSGNEEIDIDLSQTSTSQQNKQQRFMDDQTHQTSSLKTASRNHALRRTLSQRDLQQAADTYSSQSSSLTDDEARSARSTRSGSVKTVRAVYTQKSDHPTVDEDVSGLYHAMRKEVRDAFDEIRIKLEKVMVTKPSAITGADSVHTEGSNVVKKELLKSEKRKQELLDELAAEEYRGLELIKIIRGLHPEMKQNAKQGRPLRGRRRSSDKTIITKTLTQEAEKYFEDFLLNVEDTDLSSFDGEKSDTSSTIGGGSIKSKERVFHSALAETQDYLAIFAPPPDDTDGVVLPWLQWDMNNEISLVSSNKDVIPTPGDNLSDAMQQEPISVHNNSSNFPPRNNHDSWSGCCNGASKTKLEKEGEARGFISGLPVSRHHECPSFDMSEYISCQQDEDLLFEMCKHKQRIDSGSLIYCKRSFGRFAF